MAKYGIPYMGSKGNIAEKIISFLPIAENFYDLFGGGFSISHCAMISKKWNQVHYNEINADTVDLVKRAIDGEFNYNKFKPKFISREEFFEKKDSDPYIRIVWSFGNNQKDYLFSKEIEGYKKSLHNFVVFGELDETAKKYLGIEKNPSIDDITARRIFCRQRIKQIRGDIQRLQQLQQLERLQQLEQLRTSSLSYEQVPIKSNSIVYCDPPYKGTAEYNVSFDHDKFYKWCVSSPFPVFVSEYDMKVDGMYLVNYFNKRSMLSADKSVGYKVEKIYANKIAVELLND